MSEKGIILRLVDVTLIILIGFVSVADLQPKGRFDIPPAQATEEEVQESIDILLIEVVTSDAEEDMEYILREILAPDGSLIEKWVVVPISRYQLTWYIGTQESQSQAKDALELETQLIDLSEHPIKQIAIIPSPESPVEGTVTAYDYCKLLGLPEPGLDLSYREEKE